MCLEELDTQDLLRYRRLVHEENNDFNIAHSGTGDKAADGALKTSTDAKAENGVNGAAGGGVIEIHSEDEAIDTDTSSCNAADMESELRNMSMFLMRRLHWCSGIYHRLMLTFAM